MSLHATSKIQTHSYEIPVTVVGEGIVPKTTHLQGPGDESYLVRLPHAQDLLGAPHTYDARVVGGVVISVMDDRAGSEQMAMSPW